jgi:hypothetical protein
MSKIALSGNASGTGVFTIASPNSNSDRTLNLPDSAGTIVVSGTTPSLNGITFPASQVTSADANTLDDYEEGTWTPVSGTNIVVAHARYTKIGNVVTIAASVLHSGSITSYNKITLPFAPAASGDARYTGGVQFFENGSGTSAINIRLLTQVNISPECFFWGNSGSEAWPYSMVYDGTNGVSGYNFTMTYMA